ncbi:MAG: hypothetical protein GY707_01545, partial [Desulfobacteraceae bacterium]|nr:hypothetical protein [Desulfobacteraceae bacterium]
MGIKTIEDFANIKERKQFDFSVNGKEMEVYKFEATESMFSCFNLEITLAS